MPVVLAEEPEAVLYSGLGLLVVDLVSRDLLERPYELVEQRLPAVLVVRLGVVADSREVLRLGGAGGVGVAGLVAVVPEELVEKVES